jgi:mannose-6-phosphate isomerase-like protein (cupin superfamily)
MTVIHIGGKTWRQGSRPEWMRTPSAGFFSLAKEGNRHDCHFHELNELYFISRGKAKILNGGQEYYVQESDIVCIKAGDEHDILEVYGEEDLQLFYAYEIGSPDARLGHLHTSPEKAIPHAVARRPIPPDFPHREF